MGLGLFLWVVLIWGLKAWATVWCAVFSMISLWWSLCVFVNYFLFKYRHLNNLFNNHLFLYLFYYLSDNFYWYCNFFILYSLHKNWLYFFVRFFQHTCQLTYNMLNFLNLQHSHHLLNYLSKPMSPNPICFFTRILFYRQRRISIYLIMIIFVSISNKILYILP